MILEQTEAEDRLNSADNLIHHLRSATKLNSAVVRKEFDDLHGIIQPSGGDNNPCLPPASDELIADIETKLKLGLANGLATEVLHDAVAMLQRNLINIDPTKPERLSRIATDMSKIVNGINEARGNNKNSSAPTIIYRPIMMNENHYETINVHE